MEEGNIGKKTKEESQICCSFRRANTINTLRWTIIRRKCKRNKKPRMKFTHKKLHFLFASGCCCCCCYYFCWWCCCCCCLRARETKSQDWNLHTKNCIFCLPAVVVAVVVISAVVVDENEKNIHRTSNRQKLFS